MGEVRFRLNDKLHEELKDFARENGMDMTEALEGILEEYFENPWKLRSKKK